MAQYALKAGQWTATTLPAQVGSLYNLGLSDGTNYYGYVFPNRGSQSTGMKEKSDVNTRQAMTSYGSPNLVDRDLVFYPRVSQGDFSGGGLQTVFIDPTKFYDADLEIRTPSYLTLRPGWQRQTLVASTGTYQCVVFNGTVWTCLGTTNVYRADGTSVAMGMAATQVATDGNVLFVSDGVNTIKTVSATNVVATLFTGTGALKQMWYVNQGTTGRFLYYTTDNKALQKLDTTALVSVAVPPSTSAYTLVDVRPYQTGIAILTKDVNGGGSGDVWYFDSANLTRIASLYQYTPIGMTDVLGSLYVTAQSTGMYEAPVLFRIDAGTISVAAKVGSPLAQLTSASIGAPIASGQYVYFALTSPQIIDVDPTAYIGVFDHMTGAYSHLGRFDANDLPQVTQPRQIAASGRAVAFPMTLGGSATLQYQTNSSLLPAGGPAYISAGTLVSSRLDFGTPSIPKRFRRIEIVHAPLGAGESVKVSAFVDLDPTAYTLGMAPTPSGATVTNSTVGATFTGMTMGADTVGRTMYFALTLSGPGTTSPKVTRVAVEIGGTWAWDIELDCTAKRRTLGVNPDLDPQGVSGKDLYFLLRNAYENGQPITVYLAEGVTYTAAIEQVEGDNISYFDKPGNEGGPVKADEEWLCKVTLRQSA